MRKSAVIYSLLFLCFWSHLSRANDQIRFPEIPSKNKPLSVHLQSEYFRSQSNYLSFGQYVDLPHKNLLQYGAFHPSISYSPLSEYISLELFANSFYVSSKAQEVTREVYRLTVLGLGLKYFYNWDTLYAGFELRGGGPVQTFCKNSNEVLKDSELIVGDGACFVEPGLWFLFQPSPSFYVYHNLAFRYRMSPLSGLLYNRLGGVLQSPRIDTGVALHSFVSIPTNAAVRSERNLYEHLKKVNGGSYKFYSIHPSVFSWMSWVEMKFPPVFTTLYFNMDTLGINYGRGFSVGLIAKFQWNTKSSLMKKRSKGMRFNFFEGSQESSVSKGDYFEEEEDSYSKKNIKKELKQELKFLGN